MSNKICTPRLVKGFRDILPAMARQRECAMRRLEAVFQSYGYQPIDTPVLEYTDVLLSKSGGETEKQIFRFQDAGGRDVAMRFDLTVPFARFLVMHRPEIVLPFRRYHIGKAWRGENPQKGRYREFYQCDFDIVGSTGLEADIDVLLVAQAALQRLDIADFRIHINHRQLVKDLLTHWGVQSQYQSVLGVLDKLHKVGPVQTQTDLATLIPSHAELFWHFVAPQQDPHAALPHFVQACAQQGITSPALEQVQQIFQYLSALGLASYYVFDPSITRGLDYYTGIVFETFLIDTMEIGSVCSGGRYDNLVGLYSQEAITGVGGSVGLDRLLSVLENRSGRNSIPAAADVVLFYADNILPQRQLQRALQQEGITAACFPDKKKLDQQYRYAESLNARIGVFWEEEPMYQVRILAQKRNVPAVDLSQAVCIIKDILQHGET